MAKKNSKIHQLTEAIRRLPASMGEALLLGFFNGLAKGLRERNQRRERLISQLMHFRVTIKEGFISDSVTWEMRQQPISREEAEKIYNDLSNNSKLKS